MASNTYSPSRRLVSTVITRVASPRHIPRSSQCALALEPVSNHEVVQGDGDYAHQPEVGGDRRRDGLDAQRFDQVGVYGFSTETFYNPINGAEITDTASLSSNFSTPTLDLFANLVNRLYPGSLRPR
jgi:hypothetical protein